jgi:hypothetical protein
MACAEEMVFLRLLPKPLVLLPFCEFAPEEITQLCQELIQMYIRMCL